MSKNNSERENMLNLYIALLNKKIVEDIVSEKVEELKWEKYHEAKKIDIYGEAESEEGKITIFVENQITPSNMSHLKSVKTIIQKAPNDSKIVWGALNFSSDHLDNVAEVLQNLTTKRIEFFAVQINDSVLEILDELNKLHVLKVMDKLNALNAVEIYSNTVDKYVSNCSGLEGENFYKGYSRESIREKTNAYILNELRERVKFPNLFREKRTLDDNKIRFGGGREEVNFELIFKDRYENSMVSCQFSKMTDSLYRELVKRKHVFESKIGKNVICDNVNRRILTHVNEYEHKFDKIDQLVNLMDEYIFYLSNYTFYFGKPMQDEMWEQHKEGLLKG
ncbi:hypothetical protein [Bacillus tuaregi]|uniref:hypothetical protein n=1 Tax=Bacillus tuaregi TaxID=1816695 RepID=UPI0008F8BAE2|nr:hypothetical protein [Bacillus tuaregi]